MKHEGGILTKLQSGGTIRVLCMDFGKIGMEKGGLDNFISKPGLATPGYKARR